MDTNSLTNRLMRVFRFDASVYREVASDANAATQAYLIVGIAAGLAFVGGLIGGAMQGNVVAGIIAGLLPAISIVVGFVLFALAAALIAQNMFQGRTNFQEMIRTVGFAYGWNILNVLSFIQLLGPVIAFVTLLLVVVSVVMALRESAEFDSTKAAITAILAGVVAFIANVCVTSVIGAPLLLALGAASGG